MSKTHTVVMLDTERVEMLTGCRGTGDDKVDVRVQLAPGKNLVPSEDWAAVTDPDTGSAALPMMIKKGKVEVLTPEAVPDDEDESVNVVNNDKTVDLSQFNVDDCEKIIEGTANLAELDALHANELAGKNRKGVREAIEKQRADLEEALYGDGDDDD